MLEYGMALKDVDPSEQPSCSFLRQNYEACALCAASGRGLEGPTGGHEAGMSVGAVLIAFESM